MSSNDTFSPSGRIIDESFNKDFTKNCSLCLLFRNNRISYAVFDLERKKFIVHQASYFHSAPENLTESRAILEEIRSIIANDDLLHLPFPEIHIGIGNIPSVLVPQDVYADDEKGAHLALHAALQSDSVVLTDSIEEVGAVMEFALSESLFSYLRQEFQNARIHHSNTGLLKAIKAEIENTNVTHEQHVVIHISQGTFVMTYFREGNLQLINQFEFRAKEDFIYYITMICEELDINRETAVFKFVGEIVERSALYEISHKYLRNVLLGNRLSNYSYSRKIRELPAQFHYNLFALQLCK